MSKISDNIYPPMDIIHRNPNSILLIEDDSISINDLINESLQKDHSRLRNMVAESLISSFKRQNISKRYEQDEIDKVYDYFKSIPLEKSFQMYEKNYEAKNNKNFLSKDSFIENLNILKDVHKKPLMEEIRNFEIKHLGYSDIEIEPIKNKLTM